MDAYPEGESVKSDFCEATSKFSFPLWSMDQFFTAPENLQISHQSQDSFLNSSDIWIDRFI